MKRPTWHESTPTDWFYITPGGMLTGTRIIKRPGKGSWYDVYVDDKPLANMGVLGFPFRSLEGAKRAAAQAYERHKKGLDPNDWEVLPRFDEE